MKAERRHELKTNTLAQGIYNLPEYWKKYGNRILLALIAVLLVIVLVNNRIQSRRHAQVLAQQNLAAARSYLQELRRPMATPDSAQLISDARRALEQALANTDDPAILAEALVTRGNLNWQIANLPELPNTAATQPAAAARPDPAAALSEAEEAYQRVLSAHADQRLSAATARFGLAAVAENRAQWDVARQQYEAILADEALPPGWHAMARYRLEGYRPEGFNSLPVAGLDELRKPVYIAPATQPVAAEVPSPAPEAVGPVGPVAPLPPAE